MNEARRPEGDAGHGQAYGPIDEDRDDARVMKQHGSNETSRCVGVFVVPR
jgi:hypothetical protein